jgi:poly(3-hydroxybutyrate) depolymerase
MGCLYPHILAGVAPISGMMLNSVTMSTSCQTPSTISIPIYAIGGSVDDVTLWNGDNHGGEWAPIHHKQLSMIGGLRDSSVLLGQDLSLPH